MATIVSVEDVQFDHTAGTCTVEAVIEDAILVRAAQCYGDFPEPEEWGPALCMTVFDTDDYFNSEEVSTPKDECDFIEKLQTWDLDWHTMPLVVSVR